MFTVGKSWRFSCLPWSLYSFFQTKHPLENEVTVVDVGQGDSLFLLKKLLSFYFSSSSL